MKIYSIQQQNSLNKKQNFKAYFVNDAKGVFNNLWENAEKSEALNKQIRLLSSSFKHHPLEIVGYLEGHMCSDSIWRSACKILNHYTGTITAYFHTGKINPKYELSFLLERINNDKELFEDSGISETYRLLTTEQK